MNSTTMKRTYLLKRSEFEPTATIALEKDNDLIHRGQQRCHESHIKRNELTMKNTQFNASLFKNWAATQKVKKDRIIRDLQFELARNGFTQLKKTRENIQHRADQEYGIDAYEKNLIKNGIGGGDADNDRPLGINPENGEQFLERIEELARNNFPIDKEITGFLSQLKSRMKERKAIRHEKARRRRKGAAEQAKAAQEEANTAAAAAAEMELTRTKPLRKNMYMNEEDDSDDDDDNATIDLEEAQEKLRMAAEESVRVFAEDFRSKYDTQSHTAKLAAIMEARGAYQAKKHAANYEMCRSIALSVVDISLNSSDEGQRDSSIKFKQHYSTRPLLTEGLLRVVERQIETAGGTHPESSTMEGAPSDLDLQDITTLDLWPPYAMLAMNAGLWRVKHEVVMEMSAEGIDGKGLPSMTGEGLDADRIVNGGEIDGVPDGNKTSSQPKRIRKKEVSFIDATQTMLESLLSRGCRTVTTTKGMGGNTNHSSTDAARSKEKGPEGSKDGLDISLALTMDEKKAFLQLGMSGVGVVGVDEGANAGIQPSGAPGVGVVDPSAVPAGGPIPTSGGSGNVANGQRSSGVVVMMGGGVSAGISTSDVENALTWLGGKESVEVWDVAAAVEIGKKIAPLLEGKTPTINYASLFQIFTTGSGLFPSSSSSSSAPTGEGFVVSTPRECPDNLKNFPLDPLILKLINEIVDTSNRIFASVPTPTTAAAPTGKKNSTLGPAPVTFTEVSLAILVGQVLRLRDFVKEKYENDRVNHPPDSLTSPALATSTKSHDPNTAIPMVSTETTTNSSPFSTMILVGRSVKESLSFGSMDHVCFALAVEWFLTGGTRENLLNDALPVAQPGNDAEMGIVEGIKLLKEAVVMEAEILSPGGTKKAPAGKAPAKGKGAVEATTVVAEPDPPRHKTMLAGVIRIMPNAVVDGMVIPVTPPPQTQVEGGEEILPAAFLLRKFIAHFVSPMPTTIPTNRGSFAPGSGAPAPSDPPSALTPSVIRTPDDILVGVCAGFRLPVVFFRTNGSIVGHPTPTTTTEDSSASAPTSTSNQNNAANPSQPNAALNTTTAETAEPGMISSSSVPHALPSTLLNKGLSTTVGLMTAMLLANSYYRAQFGSSGGDKGNSSGQNDENLDQLPADGGVEEKKDALSVEGAGTSPTLPDTVPENAKRQGLGTTGTYLEQIMMEYQTLSSLRRERLLSIDARLWLLHLSQSNPLNFDNLLRVRGMFSEARANYIELYGTLLMAYGIQIAEVLEKMRLLEAEMISSVKAPDARWQFVCQMTQEKLSSLSITSGHTREQVNEITSDCICMLGTVIDDRHLHWLTDADGQKLMLFESLMKLKQAALKVSDVLSRAIREDHRVKRGAANALADMLVAAGYETLPWQLNRAGQGQVKGSRRAAMVRKDRLRMAVIQLTTLCASSEESEQEKNNQSNSNKNNNNSSSNNNNTSSNPLPKGDLLGIWRDAITMLDDVPSDVGTVLINVATSGSPTHAPIKNDTTEIEGNGEEEGKGGDGGGIIVSPQHIQRKQNMLEMILTEIQAESLEISVSMLSALSAAVVDVITRMETHHETLRDMIVTRFRYEHSVLTSWAKELSHSLHTTTTSSSSSSQQNRPYATTLLSEYYFGVSNEASADNIPWKVGEYTVELGDLTIPFAVLRLLSEELRTFLYDHHDYREIHEINASMGKEILTKVMSRLEDQGTSLASSWTQDTQLQWFVHRILRGHVQVSKEAFSKTTIMILLLGAVPIAPSMTYLSTLLRACLDPPSLKDLLNLVRAHKVLGKGWKTHLSDFVMTERDLQDAFTAMATCCLVENSKGQTVVAMDELVMMMCMGCPLLHTPHTSFERTMLLHADILNDPETNHVVHDTTISLPSFLTEGMFKAISLAGLKPSGITGGTETIPEQKQGSKRHVHYASNEGSSSSTGGGVMPGTGNEIDRFVLLSGPHKTLSPMQLQWLSQQTKPLAWKLSSRLDHLTQSERVNEVFRPTFGMILPPVEVPEVTQVSMSNEEPTGEEEGVDGTQEANNVANEGMEEGGTSGDQSEGEGGPKSNDNDANEGDDNESIEGQDTHVIKGSALDSTSLSRGSGVPIPHAGVIRPVGQQAQFLELSNEVYGGLSEEMTNEELLPFCV